MPAEIKEEVNNVAEQLQIINHQLRQLFSYEAFHIFDNDFRKIELCLKGYLLGILKGDQQLEECSLFSINSLTALLPEMLKNLKKQGERLRLEKRRELN